MSQLQKPGENPKKTGIYEERGSRGGKLRDAKRVRIEPGDKPLPPTQKPNRRWIRVSPLRKRK